MSVISGGIVLKLPRAILFDLDDTILVAFGPAQSQWHRAIATFRPARAERGHDCCGGDSGGLDRIMARVGAAQVLGATAPGREAMGGGREGQDGMVLALKWA